MAIKEWEGFKLVEDFFDNRDYMVAEPVVAAKGRPWVWRAEFFGAFPSVDIALLNKGWHVIYYNTSDMYGCDEAIGYMKKFHEFIVEKYNLDKKADMFGFSRGGLYGVNYTVKYPEDVSVLYLDAPVLDIRSWPGGIGLGSGSPIEWKDCKKWYGLTDVQSIVNFHDNPIDKIDKLLELKIPVALCAGDSDGCVPYVENGEILDKAYRANGGDIITIVKPGCDHHPHSIENPEPIANFIEAHRA